MDWLQTAGVVHNAQARQACRQARPITELVALLDSLSFSLQRLNISLSGTYSTHSWGLHVRFTCELRRPRNSCMR